jgi:lipid-A-disaccharide synthase
MPTPERTRRVFIVAGEVSGDLHGADLARELRALDPRIQLEGIGGARMAQAGVKVVEDSSDWGFIGWVNLARHVWPFVHRLRRTVARLLHDPPDVLVAIDFSGFNLAMLKRLRRRIRAIYYVPPMVSIRRGRRAERVAALGARLLAIFPFEAEAYRRAGADVAFVGHPAVELTHQVESGDRVRARYAIPAQAPVVGLLPGSRRQELDALLELMLETARVVRRAAPEVVILLALASPIFRDRVERAVAASGVPVTIVDGARQVMAASTVLLMASGTATVEAMILGVPMVVTYRAAWVNWWLVRFAVNVRHAAIPNIMAGTEVVPELLQGRATVGALSGAVLSLLRDPSARQEMRTRLQAMAAQLGPPGAARRAATEVLAAAGVLEARFHVPVR